MTTSNGSAVRFGFLLACLLCVGGWKANAQSDVTQPGDPIIASSSNSPGTEGVANAIDNTQAKYLNFDTKTPAETPSGFVVTPTVGVTRVVGLAITSANDAPERDPSTFILEGSNDPQIGGWNNPTNTWVFIAGVTNYQGFTARFQRQTFFFSNLQPYTSYRWTVLETATPNGCCMQVAEVEILGATLPPDVTQPGDPIVASSSNSPGTEGVANAIDNTQAKYLNFDTKTPAETPSGFAVSPSIGRSLVTGITVESANDAPERDPSTFILEGCNDPDIGGFNDPTNTWVFITGVTNYQGFTARFQTATFLFDNFTPYYHYRWTVLETATPNGCCMQVAEVQLLGTAAQKDITQPSDPIIASSSNSPGTEGVANAIDNTQAKYLNFDTKTPAETPSGFIVTPQIGASVVTGIRIESANDAPERDPSTFTLEGSNDPTIDGWNGPTNTWVFIAGVTNFQGFTARFQNQEWYFANQQAYTSYRWTVLQTATPNGCCMQVAEVDLLAATQSNPCGQTAFIEQPVNTPALPGTPATFFVKVNGPWTVQWYANGVAIPGATATSYSTPPVDAQIITNLYSCAIVGCQTSSVVQASIFVPSATKSIGISFSGGGANGAPSYLDTNDIVGVQAQAFWNNATNVAPGNSSGNTGDGASLPDQLTDSDNNPSPITLVFTSAHSWGAGVGTDTPTERMLNGLIGDNTPGAVSTVEFDNVPAGSHAILIYAVSPPLQFQEVRYTVDATATNTYYARVLNSDEYKPAPGFYRSVSTDVNNPTVANFIRFDGIQPLNGTIILEIETLTPGFDRYTGANGLQLVLNAPNPGSPPAITTDPQPTVAPANGTVQLSVAATGNSLTYQWRKNGVNLPDGGHVSGATTSTLTISSFADSDVAVYSVAIFNPAGSVVSKNAAVSISKYDISDQLVGHWKLDESAGTTAANAVAGGLSGFVNGNAAWASGQISNAFSFDGGTYLIVSNYTKATKGVAASAWVNVSSGVASDVVIVENAQPNLYVNGGNTRVVGQFELRLTADTVTGALYPEAAIGIGPNVARATAATGLTLGTWHQIAFSADGAQLRVYVDGVEVTRTDYLADINHPDINYLSIGAALNLTDPTDPTSPLIPDPTDPAFMTGSIDDIGVWSRSLTASEISAIYANGVQHKDLSTVVESPPASPPQISAPTVSNGNISFTWSNGGELQTAPAATGPWTGTGNTSGSFSGATSGGMNYYRIAR